MGTVEGHPAVSVVLPVRNRAQTLGCAIESVLEQDFDDFELIVVDDASTDGSPAIANQSSDPRVRVRRLDASAGAPAARNQGIELASAPLVAFQDSDDRWYPGHLRILVDALEERKDAVVAYGFVRGVPSEGESLIPGPADEVREGDLRRALIRYNLVNLPSSLVRATALAAVGGFDERLGRYQDWDLFLSLAGVGPFCFVDTVVTEAGDAPARISRDTAAESTALRMILEKHAALFGADPSMEVAHRARLARLLLGQGSVGPAARQAVKLMARPAPTARWARYRLVSGRSPLDRGRTPVVSE